MFWNIIKNATKFTPEGGQITVRTLNETPGQVQIIFDDTGIGMTSQTLQRIFRPFEQGDDARVRQSGGLGLGMAISKALVEAQSGRIAAASDGRGARFDVHSFATSGVNPGDRKQRSRYYLIKCRSDH